MKLPSQGEEPERMSPSIIGAIAAVSLFVLLILILVLVINDQNRTPNRNAGTSNEYVQPSVEIASADNGRLDTNELIGNSNLTPDDFDFWDLYPETTQEPIPEPTSTPVPEEETDPSTDGRHTLVINDNGEEEWVLISPYLPKHNYDFTRLVCQSELMKYYEDGQQISFVGVDISKYDEEVNFNRLKRAGIDFCMIRVGARGYGSGQILMDEYYEANMQGATEAGLQIGLYFFSQAITKEEAIEEANLVLNSIQEYRVTYPIAFEMEYIENDTSRVEALSKSEKTDIAKAFLDTISAAGYTPVIYGEKEWLIKKIDLSKLTEYDVWLSQIADIPDYPYKFTMWQYSHSGNISGISGYANLNISFIDYTEK